MAPSPVDPGEAEAPIFLAGIAGSGKTPLARVLNLHPEIIVTRRTYMWRRFYGAYGDLGGEANFERCLAAMLTTPGIQALQPEPTRIRAEFATGPKTYGELFALFHRHHAQKVGKPRWGDQLGLAEGHADAILDAYPQAKMVHMVRDPRSTLLPPGRPGKLGWSVGKWTTSVDLADRNRRVHADRYLVVRFEDLRDAPARTVAQASAFLDLDTTPVMVQLADSLALTGSDHNEPDPAIAHPDAARYIERRASELMARYGYVLEYPVPKATFPYTLVHWPANQIALSAWKRWKRRKISNRAGE